MSSHHIVRDEQEPALFLYDLGPSSEEILQQLLGWTPHVMLRESLLDWAHSWLIKVDALLLQAAKHRERDAFMLEQWPLEVIEGGTSLLETGLTYFHAQGFPAVHLFAPYDLGKPLQSNWEGRLEIVVWDYPWKWYLTRNTTWKKWLLQGQGLQLEPMPKSYQNLEQKSAKHWCVKETGWVHAESRQLPFWVGECLL